MNKVRVQKLLDILEHMSADTHSFSMFQSTPDGKIPERICQTLSEFSTSGNKCSAFGFIAMHELWYVEGGGINLQGAPTFAKAAGISAIAKFLESTSFDTVRKLICGDLLYKDLFDANKKHVGCNIQSLYYKKNVKSIELEDVREKLRTFL